MRTELYQAICDEISSCTDSLQVICKRHGCERTSFWKWTQKDENYTLYARARRFQMELMADEIMSIADDSSKDVIKVNGKEVVDHEHIQRDKLRIDTRKFLMSKLASVVFGETQKITVTEEIKQPEWWQNNKNGNQSES